MDTLSGEVILFNCFSIFSENWSTLNGKNLLAALTWQANSFLLE